MTNAAAVLMFDQLAEYAVDCDSAGRSAGRRQYCQSMPHIVLCSTDPDPTDALPILMPSPEPIISVSGLRGIVGQSLTPLVAARYAAAFAAELPAGPIVITARRPRDRRRCLSRRSRGACKRWAAR